VGPSGFNDPPRPFVFRTRHLDGKTIPAGLIFHVGVNFFIPSAPLLAELIRTFSELARQGFGPNRSRAALESVSIHSSGGDELRHDCLPLVSLSLAPVAHAVENVRIDFLSPTELKNAGEVVEVPQFDILMRRVRDRVSTLRALYGGGPLEIDHQSLNQRAGLVRLVRFNTRHVSDSRRSSRTGQVHPLGGFIGFAEYEGDLSEFLPHLEIARWTGLGRQTVWGKGEIALTRVNI